jgi:hypothetical protein
MNINELSDIMGVDLILRRYANQGKRWIAQLEHVDIKEHRESSEWEDTYGNANSPDEAIADYVNKIRGKVLLVHAFTRKRRKEFDVPASLEA